MASQRGVMQRIPEAIAGEDGFSLVELIVFSIIMLLLIAGVMGMLTSAFKSSAVSYSTTKVEDAAREAMSTMIRQIRVANAINPASTSASLTFTGDLDGNDVNETATFAVVGGVLQRNGQPWVENVDSVSFTYYQQGSITPLVPGSAGWNTLVKKISIVITLSRESLGTDVARTFEGSVSLRNSLQ